MRPPVRYMAMIAFAALQPETAFAQLIFDGDVYRSADDPLRDNRLITVRERPQPDYDSRGMSVGQFRLKPTLSLGVEGNSNLLAGAGDPSGDMVFNITPGFLMQSQGDQQPTRLSGRVSINRHARRSLEDYSEYDLGIDTRPGIAKDYSAILRADAGRFFEARTDRFAPINSRQPVRLDRIFVRAALLKSSGRLVVLAGTDLERLNYRDAVDRHEAGRILSESLRSRSEHRPFAQAEYKISPDFGLSAGLHLNRKNFHKSLPFVLRRDSNGFEFSGGLKFKPTPLIQMAAAIGYLEQYHDGPLLDVKGFSAEAHLKWLPTMLTSVQAQFSRKIEEGGTEFPGSSFTNALKIGMDHELLRNLVLSLAAGYHDYQFAGRRGRHKRFHLDVAARFRPNRNMAILLQYSWLNQNSDEQARGMKFAQSRLSVTVTFAV